MILILGGTTQGRVAAESIDQAGNPFFYSTKGDLQEVVLHNGIRICGSMDEEQMTAFCTNNSIRLIVDAAHPFAEILHNTIYLVSKRLNIKVIRLERQFPKRDEDVVWCDDYNDAVKRLSANNEQRLLALTGCNTIPKLKSFWQEHNSIFRVLNREQSVTAALKSGFPIENLVYFNDHFLSSNTSDSSVLDAEMLLLDKIKPTAIITKESGYDGYFVQKVKAAKSMGIKVYVVKRPLLPQEFITVFGCVGLRKEIEKILPQFYPLRIGFTTGTCATAASKVALSTLLFDNWQEVVEYNNGGVYITLPSSEKVFVPINRVVINGDTAQCSVIKDSGDDPDITNGIEIISTVKLNNSGEIRFLKGDGVGIVTLPGLGLEIGSPAINAVPRKMIIQEAEYLITSQQTLLNVGADITISVPEGKELATKTFNPKLGIVDGISIIGTSGVVKPFSKKAFIDSIKREIDVAIALKVDTLIINSGAKSERFIKSYIENKRAIEGKNILPSQAFIHYGNAIGDTIKLASNSGISNLILGIMIGKAVKLAEGNLDTHSKVVVMNRLFLKKQAMVAGCSPDIYVGNESVIDTISLARELWSRLSSDDQFRLFSQILKLCYKYCKPLFPKGDLKIVLIDENGKIFE